MLHLSPAPQLLDQVVVQIAAFVDLAYGEDVLLCGSVPGLGSWDAANAALMQWEEPGRWFVEVALPCGVRIEFKVIVRSQNGLAWHGAGTDNVVLETSLGRLGSQNSHFLNGSGELPYQLRVIDLPYNNKDSKWGDTNCSGVLVARDGRAVAHTSATATLPHADLSPDMAAMKLVGAAAAAGHCVQCAVKTTTTTTTMFTINGCQVEVAGEVAGVTPDVQCCNPQLPTDGGENEELGVAILSKRPSLSVIETGPLAELMANGLQSNKGASLLELADCESSDANTTMHAAVEKRNGACNECVPRMGFVGLQWSRPGASDVHVSGSWDGWSQQLELEAQLNGGFALALVLPPGEYECKFVVDGVWLASEDLEVMGAHGNNVVIAGDMLLAPTTTSSTALALSDAEADLPA